MQLWWDAGTLEDLTPWLEHRRQQGAEGDDHFVCSLQSATFGEPLNRHVLLCRFHTACRALGWERLRTLTIQHGRHTFISHALAGGRTLAEAEQRSGCYWINELRRTTFVQKTSTARCECRKNPGPTPLEGLSPRRLRLRVAQAS